MTELPYPPNSHELNDDNLFAIVEQAAPHGHAGSQRALQRKISPSDEEITLTDVGNAKRFTMQHGYYVRYVHVWKAWLIYDGIRWRRDETEEVLRLARETVRKLYGEAAEAGDPDRRKELAGHARRSESEVRLRAMVSLAASELGTPVTPAKLDADPFKLNVLNGTLDLKSGHLHCHLPGDLITKLAPVSYDQEAVAPTWDAFLERIFRGNKNIIEFLQRLVGYFLSGTTQEQVLPIFHGSGANGKSTFVGAVQHALGDYAAAAAFSTFTLKANEGPRNDIARLVGTRLVAANEGSDGQRLDEALVKQLTGGDAIAVRFLYGEYFEFRPTFKIVLSTNHKPRIFGNDAAIWRRVLLVPFDVTIPEEERNPELLAKLRQEGSGILAWAGAGAREWLRIGLNVPIEVRAATADYRSEEDVLSAFIDECCVIGENLQAKAGALFDGYKDWAQANGERVMPKRAFGIRLHDRGFDAYKGSQGARYWLGLDLKTKS